jgi:4-hydroxybenzoate polyprenyltransferase
MPVAEGVVGAPPAIAPAQLSIGSIGWAIWRSLGHRFGRGEGLLLFINLSLVAARWPGLTAFVAQSLLAVLILALLYFLNDVFDAERDLNDPGKDRRFVLFLVQYRRELAGVLLALHVAVTALALFLFGARSAATVIAVLLVNLLYSMWIKGRPVLDIPWAGLWGGLYALTTGVPVPATIYLAVGAMTGVAHTFQVTRDRAVDQQNRVRTSAVATPKLMSGYMALCCAVLAACFWVHLGPLAASSALVPLILFVGMRSNQSAWMAAKGYYGVLWLLLIASLR